MYTKGRLVVLCLLVIGIVTLVTLWPTLTLDRSTHYKPGLSQEADTAVSKAEKILIEQRQKGEDLSNGPCLTNDLLPGWVADIAHNPRQSIDDLPEYQCQAYREGRAQHFVEMDLTGNIIRVK